MYDIHITKIGPIVTEPPADGQPGRVSIEVLTTEGQKALEMPSTLAIELAATIIRHMRDEQSLSGEGAASSAEDEASGEQS
jgi:hypothetical protein